MQNLSSNTKPPRKILEAVTEQKADGSKKVKSNGKDGHHDDCNGPDCKGLDCESDPFVCEEVMLAFHAGESIEKKLREILAYAKKNKLRSPKKNGVLKKQLHELRKQLKNYNSLLEPFREQQELAAACRELDDAKQDQCDAKTRAKNRVKLARWDALEKAFDSDALDIECKIDNPEKRTFYFASIAHFPLREFAPAGDEIELEGAVIYEDMSFSFDELGNYEIEFDISTPNMPTQLMLQFQIKSGENGPWFTLTIPHQYFDQWKSHNDQRVSGLVIDGQSEVLKRFFTKVTDIRRSGSARFGFGKKGLGGFGVAGGAVAASR